MKLISLAIFSSALYWTWGLIHPLPLVHPDIQDAIQNQIQIIITQAVKKRHQDAIDIQFIHINSDSLNQKEILVTFDYEFRRPTIDGDAQGHTRSQIQGSVNVTLSKAKYNSLPQWQLQNIETISSHVEFEKGSEITIKK